jgi:6-phosphogluconolactonase (cycloisomerase 2 family)
VYKNVNRKNVLIKNSGEILKWNFTEKFGPGSNVFPDRQADSHPHGTFVFNEFVYVTDLGADKIRHYKVKSRYFLT